MESLTSDGYGRGDENGSGSSIGDGFCPGSPTGIYAVCNQPSWQTSGLGAGIDGGAGTPDGTGEGSGLSDPPSNRSGVGSSDGTEDGSGASYGSGTGDGCGYG